MNKTTNKSSSLCYKCTICSRSYKLNKTLKVHLNRRHGKKCPKCETSFRLYSELKKHLEEKHSTSISEEDFPYSICKFCDILFKHNKNLIVHLKVRHGINAEVGKLQCPVCSSRFRLYKTLRAHINVNHGVKTQADCYQLHSVSGSDGHVKRLELVNIGENVPTYPVMTPTIDMISHVEEIVSESDNTSDAPKIIYNKKLIYNKYTEQIKMKTDTLLELINYVELDKHKTASICNYLDMAIEELENYKNQHMKQEKTFCKVSSRREQTDLAVVPLRESEGLPIKVLSVNNSVLNSCNLQNTKSCFHYDHDYC